MKIVFFMESLTCGGKERRILELVKYLKRHTDYEIALVLTENIIHYDHVYELGIPITIISRKGIKYNPRPFVEFYKYCKHFRPDIIHTWERMTTFYAIPTKLIIRIPLISSMIADAQRDFSVLSFRYISFRANIFFSNIVMANSKAGLLAYKTHSYKTKVIHNGVHLERFQKKYNIVEEKENLKVSTNFIVIMVATFSRFKDYDLFLDVAKEIEKTRNDVTLIGVGDGPEWTRIQKRIVDEKIGNVILTGRQNDVERFIAASDIGILCTYAEGISNSIIEYMALGKPVISTDVNGGSREIIVEGETGYCVERNIEKVVLSVNLLLNNAALRMSMGIKAKERIHSQFSIKRMGEEFELVYKEVLV